MVTSRASKNLQAQTVCKKGKAWALPEVLCIFPKGKMNLGFRELEERRWGTLPF